MGGGAPACPTAGIKPAVGLLLRPLARPGGWILEAQPLTTKWRCCASYMGVFIDNRPRRARAGAGQAAQRGRAYV